ncbi:hypothetical protein HU200_061219 [Digitaria exilis]|uniref:Uncharacterized protein n=1 Tax=Digitaria exilis TaxID=1010633 RepID=A0A835E0T8_9POAL|nr:hypothetical protein HU200_061219 [Digitaria exilis]
MNWLTAGIHGALNIIAFSILACLRYVTPFLAAITARGTATQYLLAWVKGQADDFFSFSLEMRAWARTICDYLNINAGFIKFTVHLIFSFVIVIGGLLLLTIIFGAAGIAPIALLVDLIVHIQRQQLREPPGDRRSGGTLFLAIVIVMLFAYYLSRGPKVGGRCSSDADCASGLRCFDSKCVRTTVTNPFETVNGVRALMLDVYDYDNDIWLCHSKRECNGRSAFEPAIYTLREIEAFLLMNPSEIVTLILEDHVTSQDGLTKLFDRSDGDDGMNHEACNNRSESPFLYNRTRSLVLVNYFRTVALPWTASTEHSHGLVDVLKICHIAAGNRWANFLAVDFYKRSEGGGVFQATDMLNGRLICGRNDVYACRVRSLSNPSFTF